MTGDVARVLNEIALASDPAHRLRLAEQARAELAEWPAQHYGYRAKDVREIAALIDETISELRAAAGGRQVDLSFVANVEPPAPMRLLPPPTQTEVIAQALSIAEMADVPADRIAMLQATLAFIDAAPGAATPTRGCGGRATSHRCASMARSTPTGATPSSRAASRHEAAAYVAHADVRGVERVMARVDPLDRQLGRRRPEDVRLLVQSLQAQLDSARRLRLARDRWRMRLAGYRSYSRFVKSPLEQLDLMRPGLQDIKTLAGPETATLNRLTERAAQATRELRRVIPPPDLAPVHALLPERVPDGRRRRRYAPQGDRVGRHDYRVERVGRGRRIADAARSRAQRARGVPGAATAAVITPREVRLVRAPSLHAYQHAIVTSACEGGVTLVRATAVLVPTRAAALQLQRTIEHVCLSSPPAAVVLPDILTRGEWYERLRTSAAPPARWLSPFDREVMLQAGAHEAITEGALPPFHLRPALVGEMLEFYDELRRRQRQVQDFERLLYAELEPRASSDRGAERMLRQTRFLVAALPFLRAADARGRHVRRACIS